MLGRLPALAAVRTLPVCAQRLDAGERLRLLERP
jgi:hypothetical protein